MATKKFIIEVEEGRTECNDNCPFREQGEMCIEVGWGSKKEFNCDQYNLATMKITEYNEGEALLYAVEKTAERTKREMIEKAVEWLDNVDTEVYMDSGYFQMPFLLTDLLRAMEE